MDELVVMQDMDMWKNLGISLAIVLVFWVFRKLFARYIFSLLLRYSRKTKTDFLSHIFLSFEKPIQWFFTIAGFYIAAKYFPFFEQNNKLFLDIIRSSIIIVITWGLYNISAASSAVFIKVREKYGLEIDDILIPFLSKALRVIIIAISLSIIAQEFDYDVNGFVAGLGLGGVAIALAAKDAIGNLFGGFIIITEKPFSIGDWIKTPSVEGTVEDITFRSTKVRTFAQALVTVPNATLANENITNWSEMGKRQINYYLNISYDTPKDKLEQVVEQIEAYVKSRKDIHPETIFVKFDQYEENGYGIMLYFFTKTTVWGEYLNIREEINFYILEILENEGVSVAVPARQLFTQQAGEEPKAKNLSQES